MARRRLPGPIFHYIDGAADDEVTYRRNTEAYERCDLVPNVLAGVESIDMQQNLAFFAPPRRNRNSDYPADAHERGPR